MPRERLTEWFSKNMPYGADVHRTERTIRVFNRHYQPIGETRRDDIRNDRRVRLEGFETVHFYRGGHIAENIEEYTDRLAEFVDWAVENWDPNTPDAWIERPIRHFIQAADAFRRLGKKRRVYMPQGFAPLPPFDFGVPDEVFE